MSAETIVVFIHLDVVDGPPARSAWWAESPEVEGWTAGAESLKELLDLAREGIAFALDNDEIDIDPQLVVPETQPVARRPRVTIDDREEFPQGSGAELVRFRIPEPAAA